MREGDIRHAADLAGKTVLLLSVNFFGYERIIVEELECRGATVDFLSDRPFKSPFLQALTKHGRKFVLKAATDFYHKELSRFGRAHYDYIVIVNGMTVSDAFIGELRSAYPSARLVLYMWDSIANRPYVPRIAKYFDRLLSFDPDARDYGFQLRPLFYSPAFDSIEQPDDFSHDVSFVGTAHSDRFSIVKKVDELLPEDSTRFWFLYLQAPWVYYAYKLTNRGFRTARMEDFSFKPLSRPEMQHIFASSRTILDAEHPQQRGLTMRTFDTLGARKKLITTNAHIADYDFFDARNIHVIDRARPTLDPEFLRRPYVEVPAHIRQRYSVTAWVSDILGDALNEAPDPCSRGRRARL